MSEQSLDELKQLAMPALRHAELVTLARTESPNKAYELAAVRWPRRQAKATRSLAMVRRDYGPEALEAFITEHARPNGSEHAQGGSDMRLDMMYPEGVRDVVFIHAFGHNPSTLQLLHFTGDGKKTIMLSEVIERFQLDEAQTKSLVCRIVKSMLAQWANPKAQQFYYGEMWGSALLAMRTYGLDQSQLAMYQKLLLAAVVYCGGHTKYHNGLIYAILPNPTNESTLQDVINYLLEVGCTEEEVRTAWAEMLRTRHRNNVRTACIVDWWQGLKVGEHGLTKETRPLAQQILLYEFKDILVNGCFDSFDRNHPHDGEALEKFMQMLDFLLFEAGYEWCTSNEEVRELVESYFVGCIARGKVGTAKYMLIRYGERFGLWSESEYASRTDVKTLNAALERLMRAAVAKAEETKSYGIATALAEYLGETEHADRLHEMARSLKQRVAFDFAFHAVDRHI